MEHLFSFILLLFTLFLWHTTNAVSIQDFLFSPSDVGDALPRIPLDFLGGIVSCIMMHDTMYAYNANYRLKHI